MSESAERVSAMNSNFYYTEVNMQMNFQQKSSQMPQTTSSPYAPPNDFYYGFGSMLPIPSPDPQNIEGIGESSIDDSGQSTPNPASTPTLNSFSKSSDPGRAIKTASVPETFDGPIEGRSRAQYSGYTVLPPSPPSHSTAFPFDRIAFKMDIEELKARMKETKPDINHDSEESALRHYLGAKTQHEFSPPRASSSNDVTTRTHPRTNTEYFNETPSRRPEECLYVSSPTLSTRRMRRSRTPKRYDRLVTHLSRDTDESMLASSSASSSSSRDSRDDNHGRLSSARSIAAPRRAAERGSRSGLPSRRGCLL